MGMAPTRAIGSVALLLVVTCGDPEQVTLTNASATVEIVLNPFQLTIRNPAGEPIVQTLDTGGDSAYGTPGTVVNRPTEQPQLTPGWDDYRPGEQQWQRKRRAELVSRGRRAASFRLEGPDHRVVIAVSLAGQRVRIEARGKSLLDEADPDGPHTRSGLSFRLPPEERFFGLGERLVTVQHRGWSFYNWAEELGIGSGEGAKAAVDNPYPNGPSMTGFPVPWLLSNRGYGLFVDTTYRSELHLGSERDDAWRIAVDHTDFAVTVYVDDDPLALLDMFTADTGRPMVPAPWVFGPRRRVNPGETVDGQPEIELLRQRNVPTTAVDDSIHMLPHNAHVGREADLADWIAAGHRWGYKVIAYNNPYVSMDASEIAAEYQYGLAQGFFVETPYGDPGETWFISGHLQNLATIDLTNPDAIAWFQGLLQRSLDLGYDGWMHDFGEYIQRKWVFDDGRRGDEMHNRFPVLSARAAHDLLERERPNDYLFFVRSGYAGTQAFTPAVWGSDPEATFDPTQGLPAQLRGGLNLGMSGVPYWGSDISGFKCITDDPRDKEVYLRWAQVGAVSPIMMEQNACVNPLGTRDKWTLWSDEETWTLYGAAARLHTRLQPYFLVLAARAHQTGVPLMRHPFLLFPDESEAWATEDAFFLGPSLFVAPVVERGQVTRDVWLPPGRYVDWDDYSVYEGGQHVTMSAPLAKLPLLLVAGQLVPLWDASIETLAPAGEPGVVTVEKVSDRLDVVAALAVGQAASMTLADGTVLSVRRGDPRGNPGQLAETAATPMSDCVLCFHASMPGNVARLQLNSDVTTRATLELEDVVAVHESALPIRVRWDVLRLP